MKYKQCELVKDHTINTEHPNGGISSQITWIPAKFAIKNKVLKLKQTDGSWDDGWKVAEVFGECNEKDLPDVHCMVKSHRKATGDSLPKV